VWNTPQSLPGRILYVARRPPQRFRAVSRAIGVKNRAEAARLMNGGFDPATEALVEGWSGAGDARGASVTVLQEARNTIVLRTHSAQPVFLATSEAWYPAWRATLDGDPARLYATNVAFRGLPVPGGTHTIVFTYSARSLFYSAVVSAGAWLAWWGLALRARRRASAGSELAARAPRQSR
jgi:hypothetical protein